MLKQNVILNIIQFFVLDCFEVYILKREEKY